MTAFVCACMCACVLCCEQVQRSLTSRLHALQSFVSTSVLLSFADRVQLSRRWQNVTDCSPADHHRRHNGRFSGKLHGFSRMSIPRLLYPRAPAGIKRPLQVSRAKGPFCHTTDNVRVPSETQSVDANQWSGLKPTFIHPRTLEATWPAAVYMPLLTDVRTGSPTSTHRIVVSYVTILPPLPTQRICGPCELALYQCL